MNWIDYKPGKASKQVNAVVTIVTCTLIGGAFWVSLTTTLDDMTKRDCASGVQKACEALK